MCDLLDGTLQNDFTNGPAGSAAGTALGTETIKEFRVRIERVCSAEFGRNSGGQINVLTKSGTNDFGGAAYLFHRNDALDARSHFDVGDKPDFHRNQFGATFGGPLQENRTFFFLGYESLIERLGRSISTVVPDDLARQGVLHSGNVGVNAAVAPYSPSIPGEWSVPRARLAAYVPVQSAARRALSANARGLQPRDRQPARALHAGRHRPVPADRLSAVPAQLHFTEPVLHG